MVYKKVATPHILQIEQGIEYADYSTYWTFDDLETQWLEQVYATGDIMLLTTAYSFLIARKVVAASVAFKTVPAKYRNAPGGEQLLKQQYGTCLASLPMKVEAFSSDLNASAVLEGFYGIIHDSDTKMAFDESANENVLTPVSKHIHMMIKFKSGYGVPISVLSDLIGLSAEHFEKAKSGRYGWDNFLAYTVHAKDEGKYQYKADRVFTLIGTSYNAIYHERMEAWLRGRSTKSAKTAGESLDYLLEKIVDGSITKRELIQTPTYQRLYIRNRVLIDNAFDVYMRSKFYAAEDLMKSNEFSVRVLFVTGPAGSGKTQFILALIDALIERALKEDGSKWSAFVTGAKNPIDNYSGEEILFMDDVRGRAMEASDWLKLLDPHNLSESSARYRNKYVSSRIIIISAAVPPLDFFYYAPGAGDRNEAMDQFMRRIARLIEVIPYEREVLIDNLYQYLDEVGLWANLRRAIDEKFPYKVSGERVVKCIDADVFNAMMGSTEPLRSPRGRNSVLQSALSNDIGARNYGIYSDERGAFTVDTFWSLLSKLGEDDKLSRSIIGDDCVVWKRPTIDTSLDPLIRMSKFVEGPTETHAIGTFGADSASTRYSPSVIGTYDMGSMTELMADVTDLISSSSNAKSPNLRQRFKSALVGGDDSLGS